MPKRRRVPQTDEELLERARFIDRTYFDGALKLDERLHSIRFVTNQRHRWASCTSGRGTIRISHRAKALPAWVVDYILVHELVHLVIADHSQKFWDLVALYPMAAHAQGYLWGLADGIENVRRSEGQDALADRL